MHILSLYCEILPKIQVNFLISCILMKHSCSIATQSATVTIFSNSRASRVTDSDFFKIKSI